MRRLISLFAVPAIVVCSAASCGSGSSSFEKTNTVLGSWEMPPEALAERAEKKELKGEAVEAYCTFTEDGTLDIGITVDYSSEFALFDDSVKIGDYTFQDIGYDGKTLTVRLREEVITEFVRIGEPDESTMYGRYLWPQIEEDAADNEEVSVDFKGEGVACLEFTTSYKYTFDEESSKLTVDHLDGEVKEFTVSFEDDKMIRTDADGEQLTFVRR